MTQLDPDIKQPHPGCVNMTKGIGIGSRHSLDRYSERELQTVPVKWHVSSKFQIESRILVQFDASTQFWEYFFRLVIVAF